jgi:molybdopterin/thiamine biosynthesis adenylyltransferase
VQEKALVSGVSKMGQDQSFSREAQAGYKPEVNHKSVFLAAGGGGAGGQNYLQDIALSGVGEIRIVDHDYFEDHNRTRSPLYPSDNLAAISRAGKASLVAEKLRPLMTAPKSALRYAEKPIQALADGAFAGVDVVVSCVDNPRGRAWLADKSRLHGLPLIEAGFDGPELTLSCYPAPKDPEEARHAPCWRCAHPEVEGAFSCRLYALQAEAEDIIPAIQNGAAAIAAFQAEAAIMAGHGEMPLANRRMILNLRTGRSRVFELTTDPQCPGIHRVLTDIPEVLGASGETTLGELFQEINERLGIPATIVLPEPLVWKAPCTTCGAMLNVGEPAWRWVMKPHCCNCGGSYSKLDGVGHQGSPTVYAEVDSDTGGEVLAIQCKQAGLPALALIETIDSNGTMRFFQLGGSLDDLFITLS